jgi:DnaK suppressor protein
MMTSPPLSAGQRALLEAALLQRQRDIEQRLEAQQGGASRVDHAEDVLQQDGDDAPQRDADREVDLARGDWARRELSAVSEALGRVHDERFGLCADCEGPIPFDRLRIEPWAARCVPCQTELERR